MAGNVRQSAFHSYMLPICSLLLRLFPSNGSKSLNYNSDLILRAAKALPCGEGLGVGSIFRARLEHYCRTPTRLAAAAKLAQAAQACLRARHPPHKGEGRTESA